MKKLLLLLAVAAQAAACTAARAQVPPEDHPALVVPPVPPRVIDPIPAEPQQIEPVGELPASPPASPPRTKPPAREQNRPANSDSKTETKPPETPAVDPAATTQQPPAAVPVPPLRTAGTSSDGPEMAKQVRETLDRATRMLNNVDYQALKPDSRANYDNAKSFMKQAEDALKASNLVVAKLLADRAENIAKQLGG